MGDRLTEYEGWRYVYASVTGTSHTEGGLPCQDHGIIAPLLTTDGLVMIASDGAGSAPLSSAGSLMATTTMASLIIEFLSRGVPLHSITRDDVCRWFSEVFTVLERRAYTSDTSPRDFACTLLGAVIVGTDGLFFQLGDGAVVAKIGDVYRLLFWPQNGEYANTTYFVTDVACHERIEVDHRTAVQEVALFTDGLQSIALRYTTREAYQPFFANLFPALRRQPVGHAVAMTEQLVAWLESEAVNRRTDDDKTLLLATRLTTDYIASPSA